MSRTVRFLVAYLSLLAVSTLIRVWGTIEPLPDPREKTLILGAVDGDGVTAQPVRLAYLDSTPAGSPPIVVLLHGSPGDNGEVTRLGLALADRYRILAPDLPGFGGSSRSVPDYSI